MGIENPGGLRAATFSVVFLAGDTLQPARAADAGRAGHLPPFG